MSERILTDLPLEIFLPVVKNLGCEKDINALSQVNRGAYNGQEPTVRNALEQGAWAWFSWDHTLPKPITLAALRGHANIVKLLLDHGVNSMYSWENHDDGTESWFIMDWEHFELYSILDWPPWTAALACDHTEVLQVLIEKNIFVPRAWDFFNASGEGCFETLKVLVRACPEWAEHAQSEYSTILGLAISASWHNLDIAHFLTVRFLLDRGADPDPATPLWPLRVAAEKGHVKVAELLLENIDIQSKITGGEDDRFWLLYSTAACGMKCKSQAVSGALFFQHWARGRGHSAVVRLLEDD
ncbi:Ankyrin repeat-containing domain [Penicillium camemberti]|uniref:Ankyrin repeat-containing domain n=1 Tax=Penicillium camemberti (strain FM 013) TaxID=1429867 RepID=A0A0G4PH84_PENC3|nr:Ankyrin repeat-containing domain [Penicillium camemberti]